MTELLNSTDIKLRQVSEVFNFDTGYNEPVTGTHYTAEQLATLLKERMSKHHGLGLSACQLGIMTQVFVIGNPVLNESIITVFNPNIVSASEELEVYEEGCISFPGLFIKIKRPISIRARITTQNGETDTVTFNGLTARVFQHEYDHMHGILFTSRANPYHLDLARRSGRKLTRLRNRNIAAKRIIEI